MQDVQATSDLASHAGSGHADLWWSYLELHRAHSFLKMHWLGLHSIACSGRLSGSNVEFMAGKINLPELPAGNGGGLVGTPGHAVETGG